MNTTVESTFVRQAPSLFPVSLTFVRPHRSLPVRTTSPPIHRRSSGAPGLAGRKRGTVLPNSRRVKMKSQSEIFAKEGNVNVYIGLLVHDLCRTGRQNLRPFLGVHENRL
jgi:hypothetical protein